MTMLFPFKPDYSEPVKDSFEWLTEVQQSYDGSEHRRQLRQFPRRFVEFKLTLVGQDKQIFENLLATQQAEPLFLPLWHEKSALSAPANSGDLTLSLETTSRSFLENGYALIYADKLNYEVVTVVAKTDSSLTLSAEVVTTWTAQTAVYPLVVARLEESIKPNRKSSQALQVLLKFWLEQTEAGFSGADFSETYRSQIQVLSTRNNWARQVNSEYNRQLETLDFNVSGRFIDDQSGVATVYLDYHFLLKSLAERHTFMTFLYSLAGKWAAVWVPTGQHDFTLVNPITNGDSAITVQYCGLSLYGIGATKQDIKINLKNGTAYYRRITAAVSNGNGTETLTLDRSIKSDIAVSDVLIICYLLLMRSSADLLTVEHQSSTVAQCSLMFQAVNDFTTPQAAELPTTAIPIDIVYSHLTDMFCIGNKLFFLANTQTVYRYDLQTEATDYVTQNGYPYSRLTSDGNNLWFVAVNGAVVKLNMTSLPATADYSFNSASISRCVITTNFVYISHTYQYPYTRLSRLVKETGVEDVQLDIPADGCGWTADDEFIYYSRQDLHALERRHPNLSADISYSLPNGVFSKIALTPTAIWVTAKPNYLYRINKLTGVVTEFTVSGYTTLSLDIEPYVYIDYFAALDLLVVSCADEDSVKYINQNALTNDDLILATVAVEDQPMQVAMDSNHNLYVAHWGTAKITKIS